MNLLLTGGGTGGHVYPALALAEAVRRDQPSTRVLFAGSRQGMEARLVPRAGVAFAGLAVRPPRSRSLLRTVVALATGALSVGEALLLVARFRPDAIVATGGIAAAPVVAVGAMLRVPVIVLDGNAVPGRINRVLARWGRVVAVAWDDTVPQVGARRVVVTGLPVRREVYATTREAGLRALRLDARRRTVLILGGSQGAASLNAAAADAVRRLAGRGDLQVLHQVGTGWAVADGAAVRDDQMVEDVRYVRVPYVEQIGAAYACADLVVSRCGATALAEITAAGVAAILVPYRYAAEDHQTRNAAPLVTAGAAVVVPDASLDGETLARAIASVLDSPGRLAQMTACSRALGHRDAADAVLALVGSLVRRRATREVHG